MTSEVQKRTERVLKYLPDNLDSAYDLASGGMGVHMHALGAFFGNADLSKSDKISLQITGSNYIHTPYVRDWRKGDSSYFSPVVESPDSEKHKSLISEMMKCYGRLDRMVLRLLINGEDVVWVEELSQEEFTRDEFNRLLFKAHDSELISISRIHSDDLDSIEVPNTLNGFIRALYRSGVEVSDKLIGAGEAVFSDLFRSYTLMAASYKLGAMLAITDQFTFEAQELGSSVSREYRPERALGEWEDNWRKLFGEEMPGIGQLYENGHAVLTQVAGDWDNPFLKHILAKPSLDQLS